MPSRKEPRPLDICFFFRSGGEQYKYNNAQVRGGSTAPRDHICEIVTSPHRLMKIGKNTLVYCTYISGETRTLTLVPSMLLLSSG